MKNFPKVILENSVSLSVCLVLGLLKVAGRADSNHSSGGENKGVPIFRWQGSCCGVPKHFLAIRI